MMTPKWRATLRLRRLLRLLVEQDVPIGKLQLQVARASELADSDLVQAEANDPFIFASMSGELSRRMTEQVIDEEPFEPPKHRHPGEPSDLLRVHDEVTRRRDDATLDAKAATSDADVHATTALRDELDELLAFMAPLHGRPLPDLARFEAWLDGPEFAEVLQEYDYECPSKPGDAAFEAVKAAIRKAARQ